MEVSPTLRESGEQIVSIVPHRLCRLPGDSQPQKASLDYYLWLAKLAEKGKISGIFFADVYGVDDGFPGQMAEQFRAGANCAQLDPIVYISAMASVTKSLCFGVTASTSYINVSIMIEIFASKELTAVKSHSYFHGPTPLWTMPPKGESPGTSSQATPPALPKQMEWTI